MLDGAFVVVDEGGVRTHIPVGGLVCLMLEPGTRISHAAVVLAARAGTLLIWVGEAGVRLYAAGQPGARGQTGCCSRRGWRWMTTLRLRVVRKMYALRFQEDAPDAPVGRSVAWDRGRAGAGDV